MTTVVRWKTVRFGACAQEIRNAHSHAPLRPLEHTRQKSVIMQVAMIFSKPFLLESRQPEEYQKMRSIRICPAVLSKWDRRMQVRSGICPAAFQMGSHLREDAMLICVTGAKWHLPCNAFQMGSCLQEDAMLSSASQVRSGICPAMLSKWDRICKRMLRSSASQICNKM